MSEVVEALSSTVEGREFGRKLIRKHFHIDSLFAMSPDEAFSIVLVANTMNGYHDKEDYWNDGYDLAIGKVISARLSADEVTEMNRLVKEFNSNLQEDSDEGT